MKITHCFNSLSDFASAAALPRVSAQEYFNRIDTPEVLAPCRRRSPAQSGRRMPRKRWTFQIRASPHSPLGGKYNMALGDFHFGLAAGVGFEYNNNINYAPSGQQISGWAFRPSVTIDSSYSFSEMNTLRFSLGRELREIFRPFGVRHARLVDFAEFHPRTHDACGPGCAHLPRPVQLRGGSVLRADLSNAADIPPF